MDSTIVLEGTELPPELQKPLVPMEATEEEKKKLRVLVAIDESELSFYALQWTLDNIFKNSGAGETASELMSQQDSDMITLVHVMSPFQHFVYPAAGPGSQFAIGTAGVYAANNAVESVRKGQSEIAAGILGRALKLCKEKGVKAESLLLEGDPMDMICQVVQEMNVDFLVLGSRGLGMIKRALLGSVSDYCVHHAKCPVLIVKPPKDSSTHHDEQKKK